MQPNFKKHTVGYEHHQVLMKKLNVNNLMNQNNSHLNRPSNQF